ncbi:MAG TPA: DNA gyrase inhibitor YacG [Aestuariivirgaceae bacterium]|nr:DNA gyrase inhibitor YacG [Aestuariivirgaceae bacterium]
MVPREPAGPVRLKPRRPCPICGKPSSHKLHPFCSARCADIDLHRWLGGTYTIPTEEAPQHDAEKPDSKDDDS